MNFLKGMYEKHGAKASLVDDWVVVEDGRLRTRAAHFNHRQYPQGLVLQTDVISALPSGENIVESFAGTGTNLDDALKDACANYQDSVFHVLDSAILGKKSDQVEIEDLEIGGIPRRVTYGGVRIRGELPEGSWPAISDALQSQLKNSKLPRGLHWVRYFYAHLPKGSPEIEVLLDNNEWSEQKSNAASCPWPAADKFYSARLFLIIQDR